KGCMRESFRNGKNVKFSIKPAKSLLEDNHPEIIRFLAVARNGIDISDKPKIYIPNNRKVIVNEKIVKYHAPVGEEYEGNMSLHFIRFLGLKREQVTAFLELYGFWLGDGTLTKHT